MERDTERVPMDATRLPGHGSNQTPLDPDWKDLTMHLTTESFFKI